MSNPNSSNEINESEAIISDNMADACRTLCKICGGSFPLSSMRGHTQSRHNLQITLYKEKYGPFEIIEPKVYHKCYICGKVVLLDNDWLGGHIKSTHKMKEKAYKDKYMTLNIKARQAEATTREQRPKNARNLSRVTYDFETTFPDFEYDCNLPHCDMCQRNGAHVHIDLNEFHEAKLHQEKLFLDTATKTTDDSSNSGSFSELEVSCDQDNVRESGASSSFTDINVSSEEEYVKKGPIHNLLLRSKSVITESSRLQTSQQVLLQENLLDENSPNSGEEHNDMDFGLEENLPSEFKQFITGGCGKGDARTMAAQLFGPDNEHFNPEFFSDESLLSELSDSITDLSGNLDTLSSELDSSS